MPCGKMQRRRQFSKRRQSGKSYTQWEGFTCAGAQQARKNVLFGGNYKVFSILGAWAAGGGLT